MQYLKLFKESNSSEDPKEMVNNILSYANEFRDDYGYIADIQIILGDCGDLTPEEAQEIDRETMIRCLTELLNNKSNHWWNKKYYDFMETYNEIIEQIESHLSIDDIKDLFEDVSSDYEVEIRKTVTSGPFKTFSVEVMAVPNSEVPKLVSRYYNVVGSRLPKEWVITYLKIQNLEKMDYKGSDIFIECRKLK